MWVSLGLFIASIVSTGEHHRDNTDFDFEIGQTFNELSPESQEMLHHSKHFDQNNSTEFLGRSAPNTDNCFSYSKTCQPDFEHHIFKVPMRDHQGYFYTITFSYNWRILNIENDYSHG